MNVTFDFGKLATIKEPEYKHVGQAMHEASEAIATAMRAAMSGTVFPGMTRQVKKTSLSEHGVSRSDNGLFEFSVQTPEEVEKAVAPYDMKCVVNPKSRVLTSNGWRFIKDVAVGDLVLTHKGRFRRVLATSTDLITDSDKVFRVKFDIATRKVPSHLVVTSNHPFLIDGNWVSARNIRPGMNLKLLAHACANEDCENLTPYYRETCCLSCARSVSNRRSSARGNHPMQKETNRIRQSVWIKELNYTLLSQGMHVTQREDVRNMWRERTGRGEHPFQIAWREYPEQLMYLAHQGLGAKHHGKTTLEDRMNEILDGMSFTTGWSKDMSDADFIRQYKVARASLKRHNRIGFRNRWYFLDFAHIKEKIAIECNGERFHSPEKDAPRIAELESLGWRVLQFDSKQIFRDPEAVKSEIAAVFGNHQGNFKFIDVICASVKECDWPHKTKYDIQVEEDESFVCNGIVVHNSGLLRGPKHRVGKNGPYNIVPFKHKGSDLPGAVAEMAAQLMLSQIIGEKLEVRSDDQWEIMRNTYNWGANLGKQENKRHSNMYRFGDDKYITFRTVSAKSKPSSWWHPGFPENPVSDSVWKLMEPTATWKVTAGWREAIMAPWQ